MQASEGVGRYDNLHGDEPELTAERAERQCAKDDYEADHWDDWSQDDDPQAAD